MKPLDMNCAFQHADIRWWSLVKIAPWVVITAVSSGCDSGSVAGGERVEQTLTQIDVVPDARGLLPSVAPSDSAFESDHYTGRDNCTSCHDGDNMQIQTEAGALNVSIGRDFETSAMANATRDPYWHAVVSAELHRYPELTDEINTTCTVCHAPMAVDMAKKQGANIQPFDTGSVANGDFKQGIYSMDSTNEQFNHAMGGVSCSFCHQIADVGLGSEDSFTGGYTVLSPPDNIQDRPAYGQYGDPEGTYMRQQSDMTPVYSAHLSTSETCATCHNLDSSSVDTHGIAVPDAPKFPEQTIFTEWQQSDYAVGTPQESSCQACHMPRIAQPVQLSSLGGEMRSDFAQHSFLGANTVLQDMLHNYAQELGVPEELDFPSSIARNREFLKTAATLDITDAQQGSGTLEFTVQVRNNTGHKLPSGYHSRRVYLHVQVINELGEQVFESGRIRSDGSIVGVDEDRDPKTWEAHHDLITQPWQVQVYQSVMSNSDGERAHSLLNSLDYFKDNRLLPQGLQKANATPDIAVKGLAASDDDFDDGRDDVGYRIAIDGTGSYSVFAELRYQPLSYGHLMDLFQLSEKVDTVDMFRTIYEATELRDEIIDTVVVVVE